MNKNNIQIAFCFDQNIMWQACIAIASLLKSGVEDNCHYDIYVIYSNNANDVKEFLEQYIEKVDNLSTITFIPSVNNFKNAFEIRGITTATYERLNLPEVLTDIDKVIYADVDVLFLKGLKELWNAPLENNYFAACQVCNFCTTKMWNTMLEDSPYLNEIKLGNYINAGVLLINLKEIRNSNLKQQWLELSGKKLTYQDQDIINLTAKDRILFLPHKFNISSFSREEFINECENNHQTKEELLADLHNHVIIHYTGDKPWKSFRIYNGERYLKFLKSDKEIYKLYKEKIKEKIKFNKFLLKKVIQSIFSIVNEYKGQRKHKIVTIMGIKISFAIKNDNIVLTNKKMDNKAKNSTAVERERERERVILAKCKFRVNYRCAA